MTAEFKPLSDVCGAEVLNIEVTRPLALADVAAIEDAFNKVSPSKWSNVTIRPGDTIRFQTPGGGGWGDPGKRPREQIEEDLREGYISSKHAQEVYGVGGSGDD